jgi:hypothetical protein
VEQRLHAHAFDSDDVLADRKQRKQRKQSDSGNEASKTRPPIPADASHSVTSH